MFEPTRAALGAAAGTSELPATLQELVMARLDRISDNRDVAQVAATLGREFDYDLLAAVVTIDEQTAEVRVGQAGVRRYALCRR